MSTATPLRRRRLAPLALVACLLAGTSAPAEPTSSKPERVVLVILGGGVRTKEFLGRPDLLPTVHAIGAAGFASDGWAAGSADPNEATKAILCGRTHSGAVPGRVRPEFPTLLEYVRGGLALPPEAVWYASYADGEALTLGVSDHSEFGERVAPRVASGDGPFAESLRALFRLHGRPNPTNERTWAQLARLRRTTREEAARRMGPHTAAEDAVEGLRVERALLEESDRRAGDVGGPARLDVRAMRMGLTVLRIFRPKLLVIRLGQADVAQRSLFEYWEVLKQADAEIASLRAEIASDPALRGKTTLLVTTDLGRDAEQNAAGGYGRSDGSKEQSTAAIVGEGPGLRRGAFLPALRDVRDLCPTLGRLLGVPTPFAQGAVREELLSSPVR